MSYISEIWLTNRDRSKVFRAVFVSMGKRFLTFCQQCYTDLSNASIPCSLRLWSSKCLSVRGVTL